MPMKLPYHVWFPLRCRYCIAVRFLFVTLLLFFSNFCFYCFFLFDLFLYGFRSHRSGLPDVLNHLAR